MYRSANMIMQEANESPVPHETLQNYGSEALTALLHLNYAEWDALELPEGEPPYTPMEGIADIAPNKLMTARTPKFLDYFRNKNFEQMKREMLFIQFLEGLPQEEAKFLIAAKDKKLTSMYPNVTREVVDAAFPNLLVMK